MPQTFTRCPLRGLTLVNASGTAADPTVVGGGDALASDDGDGTYAELGAFPAANAGNTHLLGAFDGAAIPDGHVVSGMFLAMRSRRSGVSGYASTNVWLFDGSRAGSLDDALDNGTYWSSYFIDPPEFDPVYGWAEAWFPDNPELGMGVVDDYDEWGYTQFWEDNFTLDALRGGSILLALQPAIFYGATAADYLHRFTSVELVIRHAPLVAGPVTPWLTLPDSIGHNGGGYASGFPSLVLTSENETRSGLGGGGPGSPWDVAGINAFFKEVHQLRAPGSPPFGGQGDPGNIYSTGNEAFIYEDLNAFGPNVNQQTRVALGKYTPWPSSLYVPATSTFSPDLWSHWNDAKPTNDPTHDYAGFVSSAPEWEGYELTVEKYEVQLLFSPGGLGTVPADLVMRARLYPGGAAMVPYTADVGDLSSWGVYATGPWSHDYYNAYPTIAGASLSAWPLLAEVVGNPDSPIEDLLTDWIDVTDDVVPDDHGVPAVWVHYNLAEQEGGDSPFTWAPGEYRNSNGSFYRNFGAVVGYRLDLSWPRWRFEVIEEWPLNPGKGGAWIRQRQVGALAQRQRSIGSATGRARQPRWR